MILLLHIYSNRYANISKKKCDFQLQSLSMDVVQPSLVNCDRYRQSAVILEPQ